MRINLPRPGFEIMTPPWHRRPRGIAWLMAAVLPLLADALPSAHAETPGVKPGVLRAIFARPPPAPVADADPLARHTATLGRRLFTDPRLSGDGRRSCASCHRPAHAFTDGRARALGRSGAELRRNTPHLFNLAWAKQLHWDGRAESLEAQARIPLESADEMGGNLAAVAARLAADRAMRRRFERAFPADPSITGASILAALASYERTLISPPTRFDRYIAGAAGALSARERAGLALFVGRGQCVTCHGGWRFTDDRFHDIGLPGTDPGRGAIAGGIPGLPAFKTPSLRLLARTAPYMHDGSLASLESVVEHYSDRVAERPGLAANVVRNLRLTREEKRALVAFLRTL
jgi:cytochrome c peroxidase